MPFLTGGNTTFVAGVVVEAVGETTGGEAWVVTSALDSTNGSVSIGFSAVSVTIVGLLIRIFFLVRLRQAPIECGKVS